MRCVRGLSEDFRSTQLSNLETVMEQSLKILIVDDEPFVCDSLEEFLGHYDYEIQVAHSAKEAIKYLGERHFDIVLLDIVMPDEDGFKVMDYTHQCLDTLVILMTGYASNESAIEALKRGAYWYLRKPFEYEELLKLVNNALDQRRLKADRKRAEEALKEAYEGLQKQVEERTDELLKKNEQLKQEIEERKQTEDALRESETRYKVMFQKNPAIVFIRDPETHRFLDVNPAACAFYGYSREEMIGMELTEITHGHLERIKRRMGETLNKGKNQFYSRHYLANNERRDVEVYTGPLMIKGEKVIYSIIHDITTRKQEEEQLKLQSRILENLTEGVVLSNEEAVVFYTNKAFDVQFGYEQGELIGKHISIILPLPVMESRKFVSQMIARLKDKGVWSGELERKRKDGTAFKAFVNISTLYIEGKMYLISVQDDITARKQMEEKLQQSQRMESIGTLAGGIAHDFNNILLPIMIHTEMAMLELPQDSSIQFNLKQIYQASERARDMVKQILAFSRQKQQERVAIKLGSVLKEVVKLLRSSIPTTIDMRHHIETEVDTVLADPTQIHQIILNLSTNASHAMREKGGVLEIRLDQLSLNSKAAKQFNDLKPGSYLRLTFKDTGDGIEPEVMDRIFEPYFTTKKPGEGTGMGLAVVHGIVKNYDGDIKVESEPGKGTTFEILIPQMEVDISPITEQRADLPRGSERILFVDDEKAAIDAIGPMLENLGYQVTARTSSVEALEAFRNKPKAFDLVITDQTMPNMTGKELASELMSIRPGIPIILCTGFSEQIDEKKAMSLGIRSFVMKPVVMKEMADRIREVLDKR